MDDKDKMRRILKDLAALQKKEMFTLIQAAYRRQKPKPHPLVLSARALLGEGSKK